MDLQRMRCSYSINMYFNQLLSTYQIINIKINESFQQKLCMSFTI